MELARSARLLLRSIEPTDRDDIVAMYVAGERVERWSPPIEPGVSLDQMFDRWMNADAARYVRLVAERIDRQSGPRIASLVTFSDIIRGVFQNAFAAWRTHPELLNHGYCTEAVTLALEHAFSDDGLALHRVQASILPDNLASCRVAEKCGFRHEGIALRYLRIRGQWRDHFVYAITAEDRTSTCDD